MKLLRIYWANIDMAYVTKFDLMKVIGTQMAEFIK